MALQNTLNKSKAPHQCHPFSNANRGWTLAVAEAASAHVQSAARVGRAEEQFAQRQRLAAQVGARPFRYRTQKGKRESSFSFEKRRGAAREKREKRTIESFLLSLSLSLSSRRSFAKEFSASGRSGAWEFVF